MKIRDIPTPALILDRRKLVRNIDAMLNRASGLGVSFRPHLKTAKSIDIARMISGDQNPGITVSTLAEAEYFASHGFTDILYAVGVVPARFDRAIALYGSGVDLKLILDSPEMARSVVECAESRNCTFRVLIEIDVDGHRAGVTPEDPKVVDIAAILSASEKVVFEGVMTHAGESYECTSLAAIEEHAELERSGIVRASDRIRRAGLRCGIVSVGSTPTAICARDLSGVTELRAGVFVFFDLFQLGLGVCTIDDLALSVLSTINGLKPDRNRVICDAGGLALSKDRGTASQRIDRGYGILADELTGEPIDGAMVSAANQEHGIISISDPGMITGFPIGSRVRIFPNHACMTAAAHDRYYVTDGGEEVLAIWPRCSGW